MWRSRGCSVSPGVFVAKALQVLPGGWREGKWQVTVKQPYCRLGRTLASSTEPDLPQAPETF